MPECVLSALGRTEYTTSSLCRDREPTCWVEEHNVYRLISHPLYWYSSAGWKSKSSDLTRSSKSLKRITTPGPPLERIYETQRKAVVLGAGTCSCISWVYASLSLDTSTVCPCIRAVLCVYRVRTLRGTTQVHPYLHSPYYYKSFEGV